MDDEQLAAQSIVDEFRQALADTQFLLAKANALHKVKDRRIAELTAQLEPYEADRAARPKSGKPPTR